MPKDRGERRKIDVLHAVRKKKIDRQYPLGDEFPMYNNLHQYSKNKIHCSCPDCRGKASHLGDNSVGQYKISDQKKINEIKEQINDFSKEE